VICTHPGWLLLVEILDTIGKRYMLINLTISNVSLRQHKLKLRPILVQARISSCTASLSLAISHVFLRQDDLGLRVVLG
jgi:hypothetical protein